MLKYSFYNDYSEGAHPKILRLLEQTNDRQETGYGLDSFCLQASELIKKAVGNQAVAVHFVSGGTQANLICLSSMLNSYQAVIAPTSGHISLHEAGAIESTGHKIIEIKVEAGKLTVDEIQKIVKDHEDEHMVQPKVVSIAQPTELGTLYSKAELTAISQYCHQHGLYLYLDGARLGSALCSSENDLTLPEIAQLVDMFYIGGTKNGALIGEAIVICSPDLQKNFRIHIKQRGALLAKGRLMGLQFMALFTDNLYFDLAKHANALATKLVKGMSDLGFKFLVESSTNQIFPILPNSLIEKLQKDYGFYVWSKVDEDHSVIRLVTSWVTPEEKVDEFLNFISQAKKLE